MKTQIKITGQPSGNRRLMNEMETNFSELPFNNFISQEMKISEAKKILKCAFGVLKSESNVSFNGKVLNYDASFAEIIIS